MNKASVEISLDVGKDEAAALADALGPESRYGHPAFEVRSTASGLTVTVTARSLSDARAFANSILRLLKAARESIQAVDRNEQ